MKIEDDRIRSIADRDWSSDVSFNRYQYNERYLLNIDHGTVCNQLAAVRHLCEAGLGLALIIAGETRDAVDQGRLQILLPDWQLPAVALYAVTPHRVQAARTAAVLRILQESFAEEAEAT